MDNKTPLRYCLKLWTG